MLRFLFFCALTSLLIGGVVEAGQGGCCCGSAPAVTAAQPAAPVAQAQAPQANRSFSYQPAPSNGSFYNNNYIGIDSGYRWDPARRPAAAKARGNY